MQSQLRQVALTFALAQHELHHSGLVKVGLSWFVGGSFRDVLAIVGTLRCDWMNSTRRNRAIMIRVRHLFIHEWVKAGPLIAFLAMQWHCVVATTRWQLLWCSKIAVAVSTLIVDCVSLLVH